MPRRAKASTAAAPGVEEVSEPVDRHVGARVRGRRKALDISQSALGERIGVSFQQVQKYERGANRISVSTLARIADALDAPIGYFFVGVPQHAGAGATAEAAAGSVATIDAMLALADGPALARAFIALPVKLQRTLAEVATAMAGPQPGR